MSETLTATNNIVENLPHKVKDLSLADDGRKALDIAEKKCQVLYQHVTNTVQKNH